MLDICKYAFVVNELVVNTRQAITGNNDKGIIFCQFWFT